MAKELYEILRIASNASLEEIRKAYKKRALETHPDRLPQNYSQEQKAYAEEEFRKVNNAYEVLSNPEKRKTYDKYGVWPAPSALPSDQAWHGRDGFHDPFFNNHSRPYFPDPFFSSPFYDSARSSMFTDPFVIFNAFFRDFQDDFMLNRHNRLHQDPFGSRTMMASPFGGFGGFGGGAHSYQSSFFSGGFGSEGSGSRWVSDSRMTRTINGVTQSVHEQRDMDGNVHVRIKYPDGRETYTINGEEQSNRAIEDGRRHSRSHHKKHHVPSIPPPPYSGASGSNHGRY